MKKTNNVSTYLQYQLEIDKFKTSEMMFENMFIQT